MLPRQCAEHGRLPPFVGVEGGFVHDVAAAGMERSIGRPHLRTGIVPEKGQRLCLAVCSRFVSVDEWFVK